MNTQVILHTTHFDHKPSFRMIAVRGQIDESNLDEVRNHIDPFVGDIAVEVILLDFQDLEFINSRVIGYFLALYQQMNDAEKNIAFVQANNNIMQIISLVGLTTLINHYETLEEALEALDSGEGAEHVPDTARETQNNIM
ncbi:MAG: STAS domain-containing protein [Candidatus Gracilibacteria bacterium]